MQVLESDSHLEIECFALVPKHNIAVCIYTCALVCLHCSAIRSVTFAGFMVSLWLCVGLEQSGTVELIHMQLHLTSR